MAGLSTIIAIVSPLFLPAFAAAGDLPPAAPDASKKAEEVRCLNEACHSELNRKPFLHTPVSREKCQVCHLAETPLGPANPESKACVAKWKLKRPEQELCTACHPQSQKNFVHAPVSEGKCSSCHDAHQSDWAHLLRREPSRDLCLECHQKNDFLNRKHVHAPAKEGACILCHEAHSSWKRGLLVAEGSELCSSCHREVQEDFDAANYQHPPVKEDCSRCHDAHSSDHPYQLRGEKELCLDCHKNIGERLAKAALVHGALDQEGGCHKCHSGHSSRYANLLKRPPLDSCLECHDRPVEAADGALLANIADQLAKNPYFHGPVRRADCSACHDPHAGSNFRLLRHDYPRQFYLPEFNLESYGLCFQCHLPQLVLVEKGYRITRFENGDVNLHYAHVHREKSRTCRACHHEHASATPDHIRESFVFGGWLDAPVKFERLPDGGACTPACHPRHEYHRGTKEPVPVTK